MGLNISRKTFLYCYVSMFLLLILRLFWASSFPFINDEAYYWDWSRKLHWSYIDHPPGVALIAALGREISKSLLGARLLVPFLHLASTFFLLKSLKFLGKQDLRSKVLVILLAQIIPAFSFEGVLLVPDCGLLFATSWALYEALKVAHKKEGLGILNALSYGAAWGIAGLFKYHAAPLAIGLSLALIYVRKHSFKKDLSFWFLSIFFSLLITSPVWIWNYQNEFASFVFQSKHGFAKFSFDIPAFFRTLFGLLIFFGPVFFYLSLRRCWGQELAKSFRRKDARLIPLLGGLPLLGILLISSLGKQSLPHWFIPSFWILIPILATKYADDFLRSRANLVYCILFSLILPTALSSETFRRFIVNNAGPKPGELADLTFWSDLKEELDKKESFAQIYTTEPSAGTCPKYMAIASLRWYWTAQIAHQMGKHYKVLSLDQNHSSYYHFRDNLSHFSQCPVLIVGAVDHYDKKKLLSLVEIESEERFFVPPNKQREVVLIKGRFRKIGNQAIDSIQSAVHINGLNVSSELSNNVISSAAQRSREISPPLPKTYFGLLHSHTKVSDGIGTLEEAYTYARDIGKLDFFAVTDHSEYWANPLSSSTYENAKKIAKASSTESFLGIAGFEYTHLLFGHYNVFNTDGYFHGMHAEGGLEPFYRWLEEEDQKNAIVFFNHPFLHFYADYTSFDGFRYRDSLKDILVGIDVIQWGNYRRFLFGNEGGPFSSTDEALLKGWRLGPLASQDNHQGKWGTLDNSRIAMIMEELSEEALYESMRKRHFYATSHPGLHVNLEMQKKNGDWIMMGDKVDSSQVHFKNIPVKVRLWHPSDQIRAKKIEFLVNGVVIDSHNFSEKDKSFYELNFTLSSKIEDFYIYFRFYEDKKNYELVFTESAPIFVD